MMSPWSHPIKSLKRPKEMLGMLFFLLSLVFYSNCSEFGPERCIQYNANSSFRREIRYDNKTHSINFEVSSRISHQILSRIARIIVRDVLLYDDVSFVESEGTSYTFCSIPSEENLPHTMINLETWVPVAMYFAKVSKMLGNVMSIGHLGAQGKFGWYVPHKLVDRVWTNHSANLQCTNSLKSPDMMSMFSSLAMYNEIKEILNWNESSFVCCNTSDSSKCPDRVCHSSERCLTDPGSCPILLSSYFNAHGACLVKLLKRMNLDFVVAWLEDDFVDYVLNKTAEGTDVMYFSWNLDSLAATGLFSTICLPDDFIGADDFTEEGGDRIAKNCDWQIRPIHKVVWNDLRVYAPEIHYVLDRLEFSEHQLLDILRSYNSFDFHGSANSVTGEDILERVACQWARANQKIWEKWIPENLSYKTPIYIGGLSVKTGKIVRDFGVYPAAKLAAAYINKDKSILPDHELVILDKDIGDDNGRMVAALNSYATNITHKVAGFLATVVLGEGEELMASVSKAYVTPVIALNSQCPSLSIRNKHPYFFRISLTDLDKGHVVAEMLEHFKWRQVGLFMEDSKGLHGYHTFFKELFNTRNINVIFDLKVHKITDLEYLSYNLDQLKKKRANINVVAIENRNIHAFLCQIYDKDMMSINNYSWMFVTSLTEDWLNISTSNESRNFYNLLNTSKCTAEKIKKALQSSFIFHSSFAYVGEDVLIGGKTPSEWVNVLEVEFKKQPQKRISSLSTSAFDVVWIYAKAFHQLLLEDPNALLNIHNDSTLRKFVKIVETLQFDGLTGPIKFQGADRMGLIEIHQMQGKKFVKVGIYRPEEGNLSSLDFSVNKLKWDTPTGNMPGDSLDAEKPCSVEMIRALLGVTCDNAIIFINIFVFGIIIIPVIVSIIYIKKRYDDKIKHISKETPQIVGWELVRNEIILNRKIGQGEFGTVFGGEAKIKQHWLAVAVKTLKAGSTSDDKVDFFSEARLMKDFAHENIVKLLGVCTIGDPALVVMEFMLHGDLRSYLLSRRHLVNETTEEALDVGPQAITKMALDVSNGLKYLTNLGFVHRDLACRNCLVHETGLVKIGDFGLTENVYNSGYIRCISNGKFPVRWMAPESLREGVFSTSSDIWSLGVLMYEIFTFGALPYHGFTNEQVVIFVKNHKTIELPPGCPANLEKLLTECWDFESCKRPTIDIVIDQLERMPLLLVPCLDAPRPQVGLDDGGGVNGALVVNFMEPLGSKGSNPTKSQKSSVATKHKTSLSGLSLLNNGKLLRTTTIPREPEKSPDICSPQSLSVHCFNFPTPTTEEQFDLITTSEMQRTKRKNFSDEDGDSVFRYSDEVGHELKTLLCNGCERPSHVLHRSVSTEPRTVAASKKPPDSKRTPEAAVETSGRTSGPPSNCPSHQQNKRHSRKKNSTTSSSPAL